MTRTSSEPMTSGTMNSATPLDDSLLQRARRLAPFSLIDASTECVRSGGVAELEVSTQQSSGVVTDRFSEVHSCSVSILSPTKWIARCSCCTAEEMDEQWCVHALSVLIAGHGTGELQLALEATAADPFAIRVTTTSANDICKVVRAEIAAHADPEPNFLPTVRPKVELFLDFQGDTLGVKVLFDSQLQKPNDVATCELRSNRSLDAIFLQLLESEGFWDGDNQHWYVHDSKAIQTILGLAEEFHSIQLDGSNDTLSVSHQPLHARILVTWQDSCAELVLHWIFPDGTELPKPSNSDELGLIGNGPYWTLHGNIIYRLGSEAENLAKLFPFSSTLLLPRSTTGALIELVGSSEATKRYITVVNPEAQPETRTVTPEVGLSLERITNPALGKNDQGLELKATLEFSYPSAAATDNVVFVPDTAFEAAQSAQMNNLGFRQSEALHKFLIGGDAALDLFYGEAVKFPDFWKVDGQSEIASSLRFANLTLAMDVVNSDSSDIDKRGKKATVFDARGINWFECNVKLTLNNAQIPLSSLFKNPLTQQDRWIQLDGGAYARVPGGGLKQLKTSLGMLEPNFHLASTIRSQLTTAQALGLTRYNSAGVVVSLDERAAALRDKLASFDEVKPVKPPRSFKGQLRPYQQSGLGWLLFLKEYGLDGILADEMGLGKTVQTLALLEYNRATQIKNGANPSPSIIVAPTSVIMNWYYEAKRFAPSMSVLLLHGPRRKAEFAKIPEHDLVITSYALMRIDKFELERYRYSYIVLDEAQNIKNPLAATTRAAKSFPSERRLALTGTPTENRPLELWSIVDFLMPGYLGNLDFFRNQIEKPILEHGAENEVASFLHQKTRPFIMRRLKRDVEKDLPAKTESEVHVEMTQSQQILYTQILDEVRPKIFEAVEEKGIRGASISILAALLRLRQVCNHPRSIEAYKGVSEYDSGKFELLKELLTEALESGKKILLFSQFREMLSIIRNWLDEQSTNYLYLDGGTRNRQDLVDQFNSDESVRLFLISLKAGGTGLNLTGADTVILYDPWWNPAVEMQAVDRAHRIGQTKKVNVYRLITENSIEQKIMELKSRKAAMVDALISDTELSSAALTKEDLEHFFSPLPTM
jgi:superfamily II DNA or RNA helicase